MIFIYSWINKTRWFDINSFLRVSTYGETELSEIILILILARDSRRIVISRLTLRSRGTPRSTPTTAQPPRYKSLPERKIRAQLIAEFIESRVCTFVARCIYLSHYQIHAWGMESRGWVVVRETTLRIPCGIEEEHWTECWNMVTFRRAYWCLYRELSLFISLSLSRLSPLPRRRSVSCRRHHHRGSKPRDSLERQCRQYKRRRPRVLQFT